ncbi:MAG TPA: disulfide bond formation protein B [Burkholderiales bacterium]
MLGNPRFIFAATFAVCAGLVGFGLFLQHAKGLEPCPMCILQRYAFVAIAAIALIAAIHSPQTTGRRVYGGLLALAAVAGGGVAMRHVYLEHNPPKIYDCGADFGYMLESFPLADLLPMIFKGTGDCTKVPWRFLGLSIAEWALIWFAIFLAIAVFTALLRPRR